MEKNKKFLWGYAVIIFVVALAIILFTSISLHSYKSEMTQSANLYQGAKKAVEDLTKENESLKTENTSLNDRVTKLEREINDLNSVATQSKTATENNELLIATYNLVKAKNMTEAKDTFQKINKDALSKDGAALYAELQSQLSKAK